MPSRGRSRSRADSGAPPAFSPQNIADLAVWLDAAFTTSNGSGVNRIVDQSGNARHADAASGQEGTAVADALNGRPGVSVTGGKRFSTPSFSLDKFTAFYVVKSSTNNTIVVEWGPNVGTTGGYWLYTGSTMSDVFGEANGGVSRTAGAWGDSLWRIITQQFGGSSLHEVRTNGALEASTFAGSTSTSLSSRSPQKLWIGARSDGTFASTSTFCEVILYSRSLTTAERQKVEQYLSAKYSTSLVSGTTDIALIGDSTFATYGSLNPVSNYLYNAAEDPSQNRYKLLAVSGHRITNQKAAWTAWAGRTASTLRKVYIMLPLNNVADLQSADSIETEYNDLLTTIHADNPTVEIVGMVPTPAGLFWDAAFGTGTANALSARAIEADVVSRIMNTSKFPLLNKRVRSHRDTLDNGSGGLAAPYNADNLHENNTARQTIIAPTILAN